MQMDPTLNLTKQLIARDSITPNDAGCQAILIDRLSALGFKCEEMVYEDSFGKVTNLWATKNLDAANTQTDSPLLVFAGHTDVVPVGDPSQWSSNPFTPTERDGKLFGRGAADMKTSIAAFITSIESFCSKHQQHQGAIGLLITSDEEGPATCGTVAVMQELERRNIKIDYCIVGEPSSSNQLGDTIKNGRRGSIGCKLKIIGTQGHIAYPQLADNPIHYCGSVINALTDIKWDNGNDYFPPTSLQISNINGGTGATNVIPGQVEIIFNLRFSTQITDSQIKAKVAQSLDSIKDLDYQLEWTLSGQPFLTKPAELVDACVKAIESETKVKPELSTSGGTSDGRFIAPYGAQVVELGPVNESIHKIDEHVELDTPDRLSKIYLRILENLLT